MKYFMVLAAFVLPLFAVNTGTLPCFLGGNRGLKCFYAFLTLCKGEKHNVMGTPIGGRPWGFVESGLQHRKKKSSLFFFARG
jgi:hypothetical protein